MSLSKNLTYLLASVSLCGLVAAAQAAQVTPPRPKGGTIGDPSASVVPRKVVVPGVASNSPIKIYTDAQYSSGGTALRNRSTAGLNISGVVTPLQGQGAWLYWAVVLNTADDPPGVQSIMLKRNYPLPESADVTLPGTLIGRGPTPCWGGNHISVYKAMVPDWIASGNGSYQVTILPAGVGATTGADPWSSPAVFPLWEGATLLEIGTGTRTVSVFDAGFVAGKTFSGTLNYTLPLYGPPTSGPALFETFGADGQMGTSRTASPPMTGEKTFIGATQISGPGAPDSDSDWNGNSGFPLPQLWDDTGHDITVAKGSATSIDVRIESNGDCLTTVGNVVQY